MSRGGTAPARDPARGSDSASAPPSRRIPSPRAGWLAALLVLFAAVQQGAVLRMAFVNDDYTILDRVRGAAFGSLWTNARPLWGWYRPWSRELHFWVLERGFGPNEPAFHVASLLLWLGVLALYFALARRLAGLAAATIATAGAAALAAWSGALGWAAGSQDLWMMLFALLMLHALARGRAIVALLALAGALLSKETAGVLPGVALVYVLAIERASVGRALRRAGPMLALCAVWALLHPYLRERLLGRFVETHDVTGRPATPLAALRTVLALVNLDQVPRPETGWGPALLAALPAVAIAIGAVAWVLAARGTADGGESAPRRRGAVAGFGLAWFALGSLPLFMPSVGWLTYYALFGMLGGWLALGVWLRTRPRIAIAAIAVVVALQPVHARTPSWAWGSDWYQSRASFFIGRLRDELERRHPSLPPHARLFFGDVPNAIGIGQPWFNPAFRVWYRDTTVTSGFYSTYRPRAPGEPSGPDLFFRYDGRTIGWAEVVRGPEDVARARDENAQWEDDHRDLALMLGQAGDWRAAAVEIEKLMAANPGNFEYPLNLARCRRELGDTAGARRSEQRADSLRAAAGRGR